MVFDAKGAVRSKVNEEFAQYFPEEGWVEHDPLEIWDCTMSAVEKAIADAGITAKDLAALGITNQRETSVFWRKDTLEPVGNCLVWQLSLIHISEPTRLGMISYAVFCL